MGRPTEMNLRDLLVEKLNCRGVVVVPEVSFRTVDGRRLVPDFSLALTKETQQLKTLMQ